MDIKCVVCGEPWDAFGVRHGDMLHWEMRLFRAGAGCPSCEGAPEQEWEPKNIFDFENGDEDEMVRIIAYENRANRPEWKRPEPKVLWTCASCGVEVVTNPDWDPKCDDALEFRVPRNSNAKRWRNSYKLCRPERTPHHTFRAGTPQEWHVCELCFDSCSTCGAALAPHMEELDIYDEGRAFIRDPEVSRSDLLCIECFENMCLECREVNECTCKKEYRDD